MEGPFFRNAEREVEIKRKRRERDKYVS